MQDPSGLRPLLVSVREARAILGHLSHNHFWKLIGEGNFDVEGTPRKRYITMRSLEEYVARMPRDDKFKGAGE